MSTAIYTTQINHRYLMNKSKSDMASLTMWILDMKCKEQEAFDKLLGKIFECLDDNNVQGAKDLIKAWDKAHEPFDK